MTLKLSVLFVLSVYVTSCFAQSYHSNLARALENLKNAAEFNVTTASSELKTYNEAYVAIKNFLFDYIKNYDFESNDINANNSECTEQVNTLIKGVQSRQPWAEASKFSIKILLYYFLS